MATIKNPTRWPLWCHPIQQEIGPGQVVTGLTDEVAAEATRTDVFLLVVDALPEESEPDGTPERKTVVRGAQEVEVTTAPKRARRAAKR